MGVRGAGGGGGWRDGEMQKKDRNRGRDGRLNESTCEKER